MENTTLALCDRCAPQVGAELRALASISELTAAVSARIARGAR